MKADFGFPENLGAPAVLVTGSFEQPVASWCDSWYDSWCDETACWSRTAPR
ncbi:hypothetical protein [Streptomyces sp. NPDC050704]|uniref:hypothetical protein n=1 Tax=Streptomyces sp. NPDC050704 TaxID=3157219 RepID=UPI003446C78F